MTVCLLALLVLIVFLFWRFPLLRKTWYLPPRKGFVALMYHHIGVLDDPAEEQYPFTMRPEMLERQILFLKSRGYTLVSLEDVQTAYQAGKSLIEKPVMFTFDDGYEDNYTTLFPLLKKYNVPALIFLITDYIEKRPGYLTWAQIDEMQKSGLVTFGSHTCSHRRLRSLTDEEIWQELTQSKQILEEKLARPVTALCYPYGAGGFDKRVRPQVFKAGYLFDFSTKKGINPWPWRKKTTLRRAFPRGGETMFDFYLQITRGESRL